MTLVRSKIALLGAVALAASLLGCRNHMPHSFTWPASGDVTFTHPKPPEGGYYENWDPYAATIELTPVEDTNPVRTQHILIASVKDKDGEPLPNRRVEWMIAEGSVGDIVEVDESGWRNSRGYKVDNHFAVSHTNNFDHVLTRGNEDASDDIQLKKGDTWLVITSPIEGDTYVTAYAPGIYDWSKHKAFAVKHWYDVMWEFPPPATNPTGTPHEMVTRVTKASDGSPLSGYEVTYRLVDGPAGGFSNGTGNSATVRTGADGIARVTLNQARPAEGTNTIEIDIMRPENAACCNPAVKIASGVTTKTWIGPKIAINKTCPAEKLVGEQFEYMIVVSNPSQVTTRDVVVTDTLPDGIEFVSSNPPTSGGANLSWRFDSLAGGASANISVMVRATRTGSFNNCAEVRTAEGLTGRSCCETRVTRAAISLEKTCTPQVLICDPIEHTIIVRNTGDATATNVRITDELPDGLRTTDGRTVLNFDAGTLAPGEAKQARFTVAPTRAGRFVNRATATAEGGLTASASCETIVSEPRLTLTKTAPGERFIGRPAEYQLTVTNAGDAPATDVVVTDMLGAGVQFISASDGGQMSGSTVNWSIGTLNPGQSRTVNVTLRSDAAGEVRNTARATARCAEATAEAVMQIKGIPAVLLEVIDTDDPVEVGGQTTYVIEVTNQGSAVDSNIRIVCVVPPEGTPVSGEGATQGVISGNTVTFQPYPTLAPKAKITFRVTVKANSVGDVRFRTTMQTDNIGAPVEETEATRFY